MNVSDSAVSLTFVDQSSAEVLRLLASISDVLVVNELRVRQTTEKASKLMLVPTALKEAGYTQNSLAETAQISTGYVSKLLTGKVATPTKTVIIKFCAGLKNLGSEELTSLAEQILAEFE
jgi:hypothetical protein